MKTVLCYGDSNTYGYNPVDGLRYPESVRWTCRLREKLGDEYRVIEEGCNSRTTVFIDPVDPWKNGKDYLKPCLNSHKPIDVVIMMLGSNDLKDMFHASASDIAAGAGTLVEIIQTFCMEKQEFAPTIVLVSPPEIGEGIAASPFSERFSYDAVTRSREFPALYKAVADKFGCVFCNAAEWIAPSKLDSLHLDPEAHAIMAERLYEVVKGIE